MNALRLAILLLCFVIQPSIARPQTVARCGNGWLERIDGYPVLHLKGTPYEMGYQHGALLRESVGKNMHMLVDVKGNETFVDYGGTKTKSRAAIEGIIEKQRPFVPRRYFDELVGLAAGSGLKENDVRVMNFIPEMFHCSGFALMNSATEDGTLYHGRVLDYAVDWGLQEHAVIVVAEPSGRIPFVNVTYAGFIGSVTGMNAEHVSIGEMGGGGRERWNGMPMALLVREALETGKDLDSAIAVFRDTKRTCQYYYVVADAKTNRAVTMEASWNVFTIVKPGESHPLLPSGIKDCVLLSAGDRYKELVKRTLKGHGRFSHVDALKLMERPVAMDSNLHNVLFEPKTTRFWIANAGLDGKPAAEQPYRTFRLSELLTRKPDPMSPEIPIVPQAQ